MVFCGGGDDGGGKDGRSYQSYENNINAIKLIDQTSFQNENRNFSLFAAFFVMSRQWQAQCCNSMDESSEFLENLQNSAPLLTKDSSKFGFQIYV